MSNLKVGDIVRVTTKTLDDGNLYKKIGRIVKIEGRLWPYHVRVYNLSRNYSRNELILFDMSELEKLPALEEKNWWLYEI
jgi:hypothetical protein